MKTPAQRRAQQRSITLDTDDKKIAVYLHGLGFQEKRIAALFDVNQGRISEAVTEATKRKTKP